MEGGKLGTPENGGKIETQEKGGKLETPEKGGNLEYRESWNLGINHEIITGLSNYSAICKTIHSRIAACGLRRIGSIGRL